MNFKRNILLVLLIVFVAGGGLAIGLWSSSSSAAGCVVHKVEIKNSTVTPKITNGKLCDTLLVTNTDNVTRLVAFGDHDHHIPYDGIEDRLLKKDESISVTFDKTGHFHFHDHMHDEVEGFFNVSK
jgi:hypothetical protein